jgi:hypothetical protein
MEPESESESTNLSAAYVVAAEINSDLPALSAPAFAPVEPIELPALHLQAQTQNNIISAEKIVSIMTELDVIRHERNELAQENEYLHESLESCRRELNHCKERNTALAQALQDTKQNIQQTQIYTTQAAQPIVSQEAAPNQIYGQPQMPNNIPPQEAAYYAQYYSSLAAQQNAIPAQMPASTEFYDNKPIQIPNAAYAPIMPPIDTRQALPNTTPESVDAYRSRMDRLAELERIMDEEARAAGHTELPIRILPKHQMEKEAAAKQFPQSSSRSGSKGIEGEYVHYYDESHN